MERLIQWLMTMEQLAGKVYQLASEYFCDDVPLQQFLKHIAEDETRHYQIMTEAVACLQKHTFPVPPISVDEETHHKIKGLFTVVSEKIAERTLEKDFLYENIAAAEQSEFNDIFFYVVNTLKESTPDFASASRVLQNHLRFINYYYGESLGRDELAAPLRLLPQIWQEHILVVDDEEPICSLLTALFREEGAVDTAHNGQEALEKLKHTYYKLIVSDIDMPSMDGLTFYQKAHGLFPAIHKRFLFLSGNFSPEAISFFSQHGLRFLNKPAPIKEIRKNAMHILLN